MKEQKGLTLIELLIVVSIIGILAAIFIPAFEGMQERAQERVKISKLKKFAEYARNELEDGISNNTNLEDVVKQLIESKKDETSPWDDNKALFVSSEVATGCLIKCLNTGYNGQIRLCLSDDRKWVGVLVKNNKGQVEIDGGFRKP